MSTPLILISNDDGFDAPTLDLLAEAVADLGELLIVAPTTNQSSMGRSYPKTEGGGVIQTIPKIIAGKNTAAYSVHGSPSVVVDHAIEEIAPRLPSICLTGINPGENIGSTISGSGTVMAAIEASSYGMPAIAFSTVNDKQANQDVMKYWCHRITKYVLGQGLPHPVSVFNVNFPQSLSRETPFEFTRISQDVYFRNVPISFRDTTKPHHFQVVKSFDPQNIEADSDIHCLIQNRHISITPISWDFTARVQLTDLAGQYGF